MNTKLSIIVPAYNEAERIEPSIRAIFEHLQTLEFNTEVIVVDDGSTDNTSEVSRNVFHDFPQTKGEVIRYDENRGKGFAVKTGLLASKGEVAVFSDADLSTPIDELVKLIEPIRKGDYDVTFGSRALNRDLIGVHQSWRREQSGKVFNLIVRLATGLPFWDTQCGFKAFNMRKFRPLLNLMKIERFGFDVEFLYVANYRNLRLKEIPVRWNNCDGTKVSVVRDSCRMFNEVRQIRKNALTGAYSHIFYETSNEIASELTTAKI